MKKEPEKRHELHAFQVLYWLTIKYYHGAFVGACAGAAGASGVLAGIPAPIGMDGVAGAAPTGR